MTPVIISFTRIIWGDLILNPAVLQFNIRGNYYSKDNVADIENILKFEYEKKKEVLGMWELSITAHIKRSKSERSNRFLMKNIRIYIQLVFCIV